MPTIFSGPVIALSVQHGAATRSAVQAGNELQQRRLAAARRTHHGDEFAALYAKGEVLERKRAVAFLTVPVLRWIGEAYVRDVDVAQGSLRTSAAGRNSAVNTSEAFGLLASSNAVER